MLVHNKDYSKDGLSPCAFYARTSRVAHQRTLLHTTEGVALLAISQVFQPVAAGGDIKALRQAALDNPYDDRGAPPADHAVAQIFRAEYRLIDDLARLPKPAIGLCHGVWMGFGVGLAGFLPIRMVTEKTVFAMPECSIGAHSLFLLQLLCSCHRSNWWLQL